MNSFGASFALFLSLTLSIVIPASSAELDIGGVPIPADTRIATGASPFAGAWASTWDGVIRTLLVVESVSDDGKAKVVHAIEGNPKFGSKRSWARYDATINGDVMTVHGRSTITYLLSKTGRLKAAFENDRGFAIYSKQDFKALKERPSKVAWSAGRSMFLETDLDGDANAKIHLETVIFAPPGLGPFPLAVINHGSTGAGTGAVPFTDTWTNAWIADLLNERGYIVAFPQRRGRGKSGGLYDEGFETDRSKGYTCDTKPALAGAERALEDLGAAIKALNGRPDVKEGPVLLSGNSRGGILSVAYAGRHPDQISGVINFVGGWLGGCSTAEAVNQTLFGMGGGYHKRTLWIYGEADTFYSMQHSMKNFEAFRAAGGLGTFVKVRVQGKNNGHWAVSIPSLWITKVERYIDSIVLPK